MLAESLSIGVQLTPAYFKIFMVRNQTYYSSIKTSTFFVDENFEKELLITIKSSKNGKSIHSDGIHSEHFTVNPEQIARLLTIW